MIILLGETLSGEIFVTFQKIRHFRPTKFRPIRYHPWLVVTYAVRIKIVFPRPLSKISQMILIHIFHSSNQWKVVNVASTSRGIFSNIHATASKLNTQHRLETLYLHSSRHVGIIEKVRGISNLLLVSMTSSTVNGRRIYPFNRGYGFMGGLYHPPFDTLKIGTSTDDIKLKLYRQ